MCRQKSKLRFAKRDWAKLEVLLVHIQWKKRESDSFEPEERIKTAPKKVRVEIDHLRSDRVDLQIGEVFKKALF